MIARRYLGSWFVIDVLSILPVEEMIEWSLNTLDRSNLDFLKMVRMLRLLRLIKLMRILRASRILKRWEGVVPISYAHWELFKWISIVVLTTHWLACSLGLLAQLADDQRTDALAAGVLARVLAGEPADEGGGDCFGCVRGDTRYEAFCEFTSCLTSCEVDVLARMELGSEPFLEQVIKKRNAIRNAQTWICRYNDEGSVRNVDYHGDVWLAAMYVSTVAMTGGVGSIVPENRAEYAVFCFAILIGSIIWAMVVGTICAMMTTGDPHTIAFRQQMDALNDFIADMKIPHELGVLARSYLRNTRELRKKLSYDSLVSRLSPGLQGAMMLHMSRSTFTHVWFLHGVESECLVKLAARLARIGYPPKERINSSSLTIMMRGIAARGGDLLRSGSTWGDDMILSAKVLRDTRPATALTYVETISLQREDLDDVLADYPASKRVVQASAMRLALKRTVVLLKAYADSQRVRETGASVAYEMLTSAFGQPKSPGKGPEGPEGDLPPDLGHIFRTITGSKLRDVDEAGNLVEQVLPPVRQSRGSGGELETPVETPVETPETRRRQQERRQEERRQEEGDAIKQEVSSIHAGVRRLNEQMSEMHAMLAQLTRKSPGKRFSYGEYGEMSTSHAHIGALIQPRKQAVDYKEL